MYKALLADVDGTLIVSTPHGLPSSRVRKAIMAAQDKIHFGIATSRPPHFVQHIFDDIEFSGLSIVSGGAQIYNAKSKKVLWEKPLELEQYDQIISILKPHSFQVIINEGNQDGILDNQYVPQNPLGIVVKGIDEMLADILIKQIAHIPQVIIHKLQSHSLGKVDVGAIHNQATKEHGVLQIAKLLHIHPSEIIGVGDGHNDIPLLMACGLKVAMGNAVDELKAIADYIAPSVEEDGLADVIEKFVL